jgi:hypothetical protein
VQRATSHAACNMQHATSHAACSVAQRATWRAACNVQRGVRRGSDVGAARVVAGSDPPAVVHTARPPRYPPCGGARAMGQRQGRPHANVAPHALPRAHNRTPAHSRAHSPACTRARARTRARTQTPSRTRALVRAHTCVDKAGGCKLLRSPAWPRMSCAARCTLVALMHAAG